MRHCPKCSTEKPQADFLSRITTNRRSAWCSDCRKESRWQSHGYRYGLKSGEYLRMVEERGNLCDICGKPPRGSSHGNAVLHIDHSAVTGKVRGLLCRSCNNLLACAGDNIKTLLRAINYLED